MSNSYIKFKVPVSGREKTPENIGKKLPEVILIDVAPIANPDFESKLSSVACWLIEFEDDSYYPNREIGLDVSGKPIIIMPWRKNYGYWTDNNLVIGDFRSQFETNDITRVEFEKQWKTFEATHK